MFDADVFRARRRRTARGLHYELRAGEEGVLTWSLGPHWLADDFRLETPGGEPVLRVTGESFSEYVDAPYSVVDERDGSVVGLLRRDLRSLVRRTWGLLDPHGVEVARVDASSRVLAVARQRWLRAVPYRYEVRGRDGDRLGRLASSVRPGRAFTLDLSADDAGDVDRRLAVGATAVVDAFELR